MLQNKDTIPESHVNIHETNNNNSFDDLNHDPIDPLTKDKRQN